MKTPLFNIHDLILVLTLAVCLLLVIFQWLLSKQKALASLLLAGFFLCVGANALTNLLVWNDYIQLADGTKLVLSLSLAATTLGKSLCLYGYVQSIIHERFQLRWQHALHLLHLPLLVTLIGAAGIDSDRLRFLPGVHSELSVQATNYLWHYLKFLPVAYAFAAVWSIRRYQRQLQDFYSAPGGQGPRWLLLLALGFALNWAWSLIVHLLGAHLNIALADGFGIIDNYLTFLLVNALFIYSLVYAHQLLQTRDKVAQEKTAEREGFTPSAETIQHIRNTMEQQQLYLRQNLNIEEFARQVGLNYREVSSIINKQFNTNFFEFVNTYRVDKAKALLCDPACAQMTILDILLESGFNSKSAFNRFFKRYTGMSAAEFRKQQQPGADVTD